MNNLDKYLNIAKKVIITPSNEDMENLEEKIIKRLSNITEEDKKLLDNNFMEYLKRSNSRFYLLLEDMKNNPAKYILFVVIAAAFFGFVFLLIKSLYYKDFKTSILKNSRDK